jgi:putative transposase
VIFAAIAGWAESKTYTVVFMCRELGVSTAGYYAWRTGDVSQHAKDDVTLIALMRVLHARARGNPGVRRLRAELAAVGHRLSHKRVWRLMRAADLQGRHPRAWKKTTIHGEKPVPAPDLIRRKFTAARANTRWCGDITYVRTWDGWAYVATVIDLYSRTIVGYAIADHMRTSLVTDALDMALKNRTPAPGIIFHSDRGPVHLGPVHLGPVRAGRPRSRRTPVDRAPGAVLGQRGQ